MLLQLTVFLVPINLSTVVIIVINNFILTRNEIENLQNRIESGKHSKLASENKTLPIAETALTELQFAIKKINTTLEDALEKTNVVSKSLCAKTQKNACNKLMNGKTKRYIYIVNYM